MRHDGAGSYKKAFTIVELLVVIVVIGILAVITVISYSGITQRAVVASLQSDLTNASNQLRMFAVDSGTFPATMALVNGGQGVVASAGTTYEYTIGDFGLSTFCLTATKNGVSYKVTDNSAPVIGDCSSYGLTIDLDVGNTLSYSGSGTAWNDLSGVGNNAVLYNGVGYNASNGGYLSFDGLNDYAVINGSNYSITNVFSVSAWMRFNNYSYMQLVDTNSFNFKWRIAGNNPYWNLYNKAGGYIGAISYTSIPNINEWHYYTFTYDGAYRRIYLDGVYDKQIATTGDILNPTPMIIAAASGEVFNGSIAGIRVYNRALSTPEILQNFNNTKTRYGL